MRRDLVERIVAATLYEGYILYPYRPSSVKNQLRWTFGGVHPRGWSEASGGVEPWQAVTETLLEGDDRASIEAEVRCLHVVTRTTGRATGTDREFVAAPSVSIGGRIHRSWEEAEERVVGCGTHSLAALLAGGVRVAINVPERTWDETLGEDGGATTVVRRRHTALHGEVTLSARRVDPQHTRVRVAVANLTDAAADLDRDAALRHSMVSTHLLLGADGARWLSLADPPAGLGAAARDCVNAGLWPVLVGEDDDTVLASPIILEDHPQVAPESPGDLFDATEIDEILSLRILTLGDDEKSEMRAADERSRALLDRTEALTAEDFLRMHGVIRGSAAGTTARRG